MARKFKFGDKVKTVKPKSVTGVRKGSIGTINNYVSGLPYPYYVNIKNCNGKECVFFAKELKLIN